jgi:hypothetical protein
MEFVQEKDTSVSIDDEILSVVTIVDDEVMGRCLEAKNDHSVGSCLFKDTTVIFASNDEDNDSVEQKCVSFLARLQNHKKKPKVTLARVKTFINALADDESGLVQSLDTARNFLQAIVLLLQHTHQGKTQTQAQSPPSPQMMALIQALGPVHPEECTALIAHLRSLPAHKNVLPPLSVLSNEMAGRVLGVMNNNQLQLELFQGSGIFPYACILQHDCRPNCSFSSSLDGSQCFITAIRGIKAGKVIAGNKPPLLP